MLWLERKREEKVPGKLPGNTKDAGWMAQAQPLLDSDPGSVTCPLAALARERSPHPQTAQIKAKQYLLGTWGVG